MSWRTVCITRPTKLDLSLGYLVVRDADSTVKVFLNEISVLIIESTAVSITAALLSELVTRKISVIFCDEKHNPQAELSPLYGSSNTSRQLKNQIAWKPHIKQYVWSQIVRQKILGQASVLLKYNNSRAQMLLSYMDEVQLNDSTNREGHAAKVYFNSLFGMDFTREGSSAINASLDYGYSILLSCVNREIVSSGYLTQIGIFHDNIYNKYNLGSDFMEPFRPFIDDCVRQMLPNTLGTEEKHKLIDVMNNEVIIDGQKNTIMNAIRIYTKSVLYALDNEEATAIKFPEYEL